jgi:hypothetical protein
MEIYHMTFGQVYCLFFYDIGILITPLVSSNSSNYTGIEEHGKAAKPAQGKAKVIVFQGIMVGSRKVTFEFDGMQIVILLSLAQAGFMYPKIILELVPAFPQNNIIVIII